MQITGIILLSLVIVLLIVTMIRDHFKNKWYRRGYVDAAHKYDESNNYTMFTYSKEADEKFHEDHGFQYE